MSGFPRDATLTWHAARALSAGAFCAAAIALGARLPRATHVVNLCEHSPIFLLASAAAWLRGHTLVLPPDRLPRTLERLGAQYPEACCLCDSPAVAQLALSLGLRTFEIPRDDNLAGDSFWPPPAIPASLIAAVLFTSGSTGDPRPHAKTWGELVDGVGTFIGGFGQPGGQAAILGTVAPQHMFGFETTIMLPLQGGVPLLPQRPALPADLHGAIAAARAWGQPAVWLLTTPLQLRAFHAAGPVVGLARVVTATMPLDLDLARAVERDWRVPVEEIYGCTEGGMLAHRRPAIDEWLTPGRAVRFEVDAQGRWMAQGGHLAAPIALTDRLEFAATADGSVTRRFRLVGRDDDVVKIAGKRASLAGLTATLCKLDGVREGIVFLPAPEARRLSAAVVAPGLTVTQLKSALAADVDAAFLPRHWWLLDALPRSHAGKVSVAALRELANASSGQSGGAAESAQLAAPWLVTGAMTVAADHPALAGHFPGRPIVPGVLLLQWVETLLEGRMLALRECAWMKFHAPLGPGEPVVLRIEVAADLTARFGITRDATLIAAGACRCAPLSRAS